MKRNLTRMVAAVGAGAIALTLAACGGSEPSASESGEGSSASAGGLKPVVVYSNSVADGRGDWLTEKAKDAGFKVQYVDLGGGEVMNRLISEKANPVADVTFGLNGVYFEKLKEAGVLEANTPSWSDKVTEQGTDPDGEFWPIVREPIMLVYNVAAYPEPSEAPSDWPDLWEDARFHDLYEVKPGLGAATTQMVLSGILVRYQDPDGKLGISDEGWEAISQYYEFGSREEEGVDLYARMAEGIVNLGQMYLAGKVAREEQYGVVTEAVHPEIGVPMVTQGVALIKGAKNAEAAREFIDWFGSGDVQAEWSKEFSTAPVNSDAVAGGDQGVIEFTDSFTAQDIDWSFVAQNIDSWVEEIELNYIK